MSCTANTKAGSGCKRRAVREGKCNQHFRMHETRRLQARINVAYEIERVRLQALYRVEPDDEIVHAVLGDRWIWSPHYNAFVQVNSEGEVVVRCHCQGCLGGPDNDSACMTLGHCQYCDCAECSCFARRDMHICGAPLPPHWDNPCMGMCDSCSASGW